ncbi:MAG: restriction endonuclease subunit S, partial [Vicinamibacteria bacterium]
MELRAGYKHTDAGPVPSDWNVLTIGDSMRLVNGRAFKPADWGDRGLPIIRIQNLNDPSAEFNYFSGSVDGKNRVERGDLLFAWSGTAGTSFGARVWGGASGVLNQHIFKVIPDQGKLTAGYALLALRLVQQ